MVQVSVFLPVRNGEAYLAAALDSVFSQTVRDIEVLVANDHSTDSTSDILAGIRDPRLMVIDMSDSQGLVAALNACLARANGSFIARMDADDICLPNRFERQLDAFRQYPDAGVVYGNAISFVKEPGEAGSRTIRSPSPQYLHDVLRMMRPGKPIVHPSVMMRTEALQAVGGYREFRHAEDRDLWLRLIDRVGFVHVAEPILNYRINPNGISRTRRASQAASSVLAVICNEFQRQRMVDIYAEWPETLKELHPLIERGFESDTTAHQRVAELKAALRRGKLAKALAAAVSLGAADRWALSARSRLARDREIVDRYLEVLKNDASLRVALAEVVQHQAKHSIA